LLVTLAASRTFLTSNDMSLGAC